MISPVVVLLIWGYLPRLALFQMIAGRTWLHRLQIGPNRPLVSSIPYLRLRERIGVSLRVRWPHGTRRGIISLLLFQSKSLNRTLLLFVRAQRLLRLIRMLVSQNLLPF
jgi:hypothetical protein